MKHVGLNINRSVRTVKKKKRNFLERNSMIVQKAKLIWFGRIFRKTYREKNAREHQEKQGCQRKLLLPNFF